MQEDPQYADLTPDGDWYQFTLTGEYIEVLLNEDSVRIPLEQWDALVKAMAPTTPLVYDTTASEWAGEVVVHLDGPQVFTAWCGVQTQRPDGRLHVIGTPGEVNCPACLEGWAEAWQAPDAEESF